MLAAVDRLRRATIGGRSRLSKKQSKWQLPLALIRTPQLSKRGIGPIAKNSETDGENPHRLRYGKPTPKRKSFRYGKPVLQGQSGNPYYYLYLGVGDALTHKLTEQPQQAPESLLLEAVDV